MLANTTIQKTHVEKLNQARSNKLGSKSNMDLNDQDDDQDDQDDDRDDDEDDDQDDDNLLDDRKSEQERASYFTPVPYKTLRAKRFLPEEHICLGNIVGVFGRKGAGKTTLIQTICESLAPRVDMAIVFSPTAIGNKFHKFVPRKHIFEEFNESVLWNVMKHQISMWDKYKPSSGAPKPFEILLILDDLAFDIKALRSKVMTFLAFNCRWAHVTTLVAAQNPNKIPSGIRDQIDICMTSYFPTKKAQESLFEDYFNIFGNFKDFRRALAILTRNHQFMVKKASKKGSDDLGECIMWFRAPFHPGGPPKFRIGGPCVWNTKLSAKQLRQEAERKDHERKVRMIEHEALMAKAPLIDIIQDETTLPTGFDAMMVRAKPKPRLPKLQQPSRTTSSRSKSPVSVVQAFAKKPPIARLSKKPSTRKVTIDDLRQVFEDRAYLAQNVGSHRALRL